RGDPIYGGSYVVGNGLKPGRYQLTPKTIPDGSCSFSVSSQKPYSDGMYLPDEEFRSTNAGARSNMTSINTLNLEKGDLFETNGCGEWQRVELVQVD
ncbi:hypothetical protein N9E04_00385, partial [bacterium]|nr:hypothetical protein [bacterium]